MPHVAAAGPNRFLSSFEIQHVNFFPVQASIAKSPRMVPDLTGRVGLARWPGQKDPLHGPTALQPMFPLDIANRARDRDINTLPVQTQDFNRFAQGKRGDWTARENPSPSFRHLLLGQFPVEDHQ